jgi:hypothetical protein
MTCASVRWRLIWISLSKPTGAERVGPAPNATRKGGACTGQT